MGLQIDWYNSIVNVTSPQTVVTCQELHDFIEDELAAPRGSTEPEIFELIEGKVEGSQIQIKLKSPWQVQFWQGSGYTEVNGGKLVGGLNDQPIKATGAAGDITVLKAPVDGTNTEVPAAGLPDEDLDTMAGYTADKVWSKELP